MLNINDILYKYILEKYGSIFAFSDYSGIPQIELNAILLKDNISLDIRSGLILCKKLNIDIEKLIFSGEIAEYNPKDDKESRRKNKSANPGKSGETPALNMQTAPDKPNAGAGGAGSVSENELRDRYMRLSEIEKKEVLEFVDRICGRR